MIAFRLLLEKVSWWWRQVSPLSRVSLVYPLSVEVEPLEYTVAVE